MNWNFLAPIGLLAGSNIMMNLAWYGHLKFPHKALWAVILVSWGIAFFEYCLAVPANRIGSKVYSLAELKTMQEVMSLTAFVMVAWLLFDQRPGPSQIIGFLLIAGGAFFIFKSPLG
ncbi:DMT family protein [Altererythrobacter sp. CC-YST694]|uniref:DMT family protein n=1 Tax=Altererythrobacter sp. CC-YST694 TaxID=2755038 RepID=UPI001D011BE1|nr:DMT family protein [Altererythrobacter sp. CC-YST694]MCB5424709.1 DMT family protein [Altererythrobacter sp. CC-YST694]